MIFSDLFVLPAKKDANQFFIFLHENKIFSADFLLRVGKIHTYQISLPLKIGKKLIIIGVICVFLIMFMVIYVIRYVVLQSRTLMKK